MTRRFSFPVLALFSFLLMIFLYAPLAVATLYAFNSGPNLTWPPQGFSLRWFEKIFSDSGFRQALIVSFQAALLTSLIASLIGAAGAFVFTRVRSRRARGVEALGRLPVMLPPLFIGIGLVALMKLTSFSPSLATIVLGHTIIAVPFVILVVVSRLRTYDPELELAARDLGATPSQALMRVTLPLIAPAIFGAALLAFAFSFDEILITNFTSGTQSTIPIYVLGRLRRVVDPGANAVAVILLLIPWIAFGIGHVVLKRLTGSGLTEALMQRVR
jgi:ABC-type spermidine/putrescine transport system permease subunit II